MTFLINEEGVDLVNYENVEGSVAPCASLLVIIENHVCLKFMRGSVNNFLLFVTLFFSSLLVLEVVANFETHQAVELFLFLHIS